jgi:hypothetical protein
VFKTKYTFSATWRKIFACLAILTLTGCASDVVMLSSLTPKSQLKNQEGIVVAQVINASSYPLPFNQLTISPDNVNESKKIKPLRLMSNEQRIEGATIFAAPVQSGNYALDSIRSFHVRGDYWYSKFVPADAKFGTFNVVPGKVTDLGTLIYYPKPDGEQYKDTLIRIPEFNLERGKALQKYYPYFKFDKEDVLTWDADELEEERNAQYLSIAQNPISFSDRFKGTDGSVYLLGKLGVLLKYSASNEFELDAIDSNLELVAFAQSEDFDLVVADSGGKVFYKPNGGEWQALNFEPDLSIHELSFDNNDAINIVAAKGNHLHVYKHEIKTGSDNYQLANSWNYISKWEYGTEELFKQEGSSTKRKYK